MRFSGEGAEIDHGAAAAGCAGVAERVIEFITRRGAVPHDLPGSVDVEANAFTPTEGAEICHGAAAARRAGVAERVSYDDGESRLFPRPARWR